MKLNILIGGKAGQGPNIVARMLAKILIKKGFYVFETRDYDSLIRGGHNFNFLTFSDAPVSSNESKIDILAAIDTETKTIHKNELGENSIILEDNPSNMLVLGQLAKTLGLDFPLVKKEIETLGKRFEENLTQANNGYNSVETKISLPKIPAKKIEIADGSQAVAQGAANSGLNLYFAYPMTPATGVMNELASKQSEKLMVFQSENEIAAVNSALGASFAGAVSMVGSSGGGFDLMAEALSFQGQTEIPLVVYLASRPGPSTGVPTYTTQSDLNAALYSGHGEFPRIVLAPGDAAEAIEKTNEAFYLSEKFKTLSIILSDKHLAESEFSFKPISKSSLKIKIERKLPGKEIVKTSSYEHDEKGISTESAEKIKLNAEKRILKFSKIKKEIEKFETFKIFGNAQSKNLVIGWGSTKGAIVDAIKNLNVKFLQLIYLSPFPEKIKSEMQKAKKIILIENNSTAQLGQLIAQETGIKVENKILKYDGNPFFSDELKNKIEEKLNEQ